MSWHRMDDQFDDNPQQLALSDAAFRLWVCSWSFCARQRPVTGCMTEAQGLALARKLGKTAKTIAELVTAGRWERTDDGYAVHDFSEHVEKGSRERVAKHRASKGRGPGPGNGPETHGKQRSNVTSPLPEGYGNAPVRERGYPVPEPVPVTETPPTSESPPYPPGGVPPLITRRTATLASGCEELLKRPLRGDERPVVMGWAALERAGGPVPVTEILDLVAHLLSTPTRDGTLAGTLRYCDATVLALARGSMSPGAGARPASLAELADVMEAADGPALRVVEGWQS